mgnify:CR=1 FL=1
MQKKLSEFLRIPSEIREAFWKDSVQKNTLSLLVICIMVFGMELFNIARVLFMSNSGLGTANNRLYFGMYCALLLAAAAYLILNRLMREAPARKRWALQYGTALFMLLWHVCINAYDLSREADGEIAIYTTAMLGIAVFIQMPGAFGLLSYGLGYAVFMLLAALNLSSGTLLNLTFTTIVALAIALTRCRHAVIMLMQRREIDLINRRLQSLLQKDPLTEVLNKTAFAENVETVLRQADESGATMLMLDLDDFKAVNDRHGHPCGDFVLRETARMLRSALPAEAHVGRIGGDEFAAVLRGDGVAALESAGRALIDALSRLTWQGETIGVQCSVGICRAAQSGATYDQLYREVDSVLYEAKRDGKGQCRTGDFAPVVSEKAASNMQAGL